MNLQIILIGLGAVAVFVWSKLSPKAEISEMPEPPRGTDIFDTLKEGAAKVAALVGVVAPVAAKAAAIAKAAAAAKGAAAALAGGTGAAAAVVTTSIPLTALPAATVMPKAVLSMLPKVGVKTAAPVAAKTGLLPSIGGAAMVVSPLIVMPLIAKFLDNLFGTGKSGLYDDPELLARQLQITKEKKEMIAAGGTPLWIPKSGFYEGEGT